ncbi:hypothetical protein ABPG74_016183 [Tetrahymena malaccensis]
MNSDKVYIFFAQKEIIYYHESLSLEDIENKIDKQLIDCSYNVRSLLIKLQIEYRYKNSFQNALNICKKILQIDSQNVDARLDLIHIIQMMNENQKNVSFQQIISECLILDSQYWRTKYVELCFLQNKKSKKQIMNSLQQLHQIYPDNPWISTYLCQFYSEIAEKQDLAFQMVSKIEEQFLIDYEIFIRIAFVYLSFKQLEKCKNIFKKAIQLNPLSPQPYNYYSYFNREYLFNYSKSIKYAKKAIDIDQNSQMGYYNLALSYSEIQDRKQSYHFYKLFYNCKNKKYLKQCLKQLYNFTTQIKDKSKSDYYLQKYLNKFPQDQFGYIKYLNNSVIRDIEFQKDLEKEEEYQNKVLIFSKQQANNQLYNSFSKRNNRIYQ